MPEYDAFGRKVGENSLADLGGHADHATSSPASPASPTPSAMPAAAAETSASAPPSEAQSPKTATPPAITTIDARQLIASATRTGNVVGRSVSVAVAVISLAILGGAVFAVKNSLDSVPDFKIRVPHVTIPAFSPPATPATPAPHPSAAPAKPAAPAVGLTGSSLLRRAAFGRAMARLRSRNLGRIVSLRVAADRLNIQLLTAGGRLRNVQVDPGLAVREFSITGPGFDHLSTLPYSAIRAGAPARLTKEAAHRAGVSADRVDYMVISSFGDQVVWNLFLKNGKHFAGNAAGHVERAF